LCRKAEGLSTLGLPTAGQVHEQENVLKLGKLFYKYCDSIT
jgi:hypothetical protein